MKKSIINLFALLLALFSLLSLSACEGGYIPDGENEENEYYETTLAEVYTVAKGLGYTGTVEEMITKFTGLSAEATATWYTGTTLPLVTKGKGGDGFLHATSFDVYVKGELDWEKSGNLKDILPELPTELTVSFDAAYHVLQFEPIKVKLGECITELPEPEIVGMKFDGWYFDGPNGSTLMTEETPVITDLTLKAKWSYCIHTDADGDRKCDICKDDYCTLHVDDNLDKKCDFCETPYIAACIEHKDTNGDKKCDYCGMKVKKECIAHADDDRNHKCDECGEPFTAPCTSHTDTDENLLCDYCGATLSRYPWARETLIFRMTLNSNRGEVSSSCERYLAGETEDAEYIDERIKDRNDEAEYYTDIDVTYEYYPDEAEYAWGRCVENILSEVMSAARDIPDMYCNFTYDLTLASLKGCFRNLCDTSPDNYLEFVKPEFQEADSGYMYWHMQSLSLSRSKMYILASDYFIDTVRALYIMPVNIELLEKAGALVTGNADYTVRDFSALIESGGWTYEALAAYAAAVHVDDGNSTTTNKWLGDSVVGLALSPSYAAKAFLYTSSVVVIDRLWNATENDWNFYYPDYSASDLPEFASALSTLMSSNGTVYVTRSSTPDIAMWGTTEAMAIRSRFSQGNVLFGDVILLENLEHAEYQNMKWSSPFTVAPVPSYKSGDSCNTQISDIACLGAISSGTLKFAACTAFLNYQSMHSSDILNDYYDYHICYGVTDGDIASVEVLQYLRTHVRSSFDSTIESMISANYGAPTVADKFRNASLQLPLDSNEYSYIALSKEALLQRLIAQVETLP